jgi:hypothetical protein
MKKLRKGPELKMPELRVPSVLADVYYDLRDRRLLPLVALVVVATAAVPFLLGDKSEEPAISPAAGVVGAPEAGGANSSSLTVVEATPGLRDYRRRLRDRSPTDPFEQRYAAPAGGGSSGSGNAASASSEGSSPSGTFSEEAITTESSSTTVEVSGGGGPSNGDGSGSSGANAGPGAKPHLIVFDYAVDARIAYSPPEGQGGGQPPEPFVAHRVLPQTPLPGEKAPVVTYMGPGRKEGDKATGRVLLLVSGDVQSISGEHRCVSSRADGICQLLEVEPGFPLSFAYGAGGAHYTIKVLSIELVVTGHS